MWSYEQKVIERGKCMQFDEDTKCNLSKVSKWLSTSQRKSSLIICGLYGNGKTTLLKALQFLLNTLIDYNKIDKDLGLRIIHAKDVMKAISTEELKDNLYQKKILAIDDLGTEATQQKEYGNTQTPITDLLEYRYKHQLTTFVTTNLTPKEIRQHYGDRIADRCNEMFDILAFKNKSYRR